MEDRPSRQLLTRGTGRRWVLVLLHRYVGLSIAAFLVIAGLTGSILAFEPELDAALNPELFRADAASGQPPLPVGALIERVEAANPELKVSSALLTLDPGTSALLSVESTDPGKVLGFDQLFVDRATGRALGRRLWGACCLERKQLIPFIYQVHMTLYLPGAAGTLLMGGVALAWLFDSIVGLLLAWPRTRVASHGWAQTLTLKSGAAGFRRVFDLHRLAGLWPWLLLIASAVTGAAMNLRYQIVQPLVEAVSPLTPGPADDTPDPKRPPALLSFDQAGARAVDAVHGKHRDPTIFYAVRLTELGLYGFAIEDPVGNPRNGLGPSWVYIDDRTGAARHRQIMGEGSAGDIFFQAALPIHSGRIAGTPGRALTAVYGLAVALLSLTGVYIWWRKRKARIARETRTSRNP